MKEHKFPYEWYLKDGYPAKGIEKHGLKVFSCFSCGGGSTMGYKLAGYDVIGNNEIDPKMMAAYRANHNPSHSFLEPIQEFVKRETYPAELYELDILDGSPPCSSFSTAGNREKDWGKEKKFREGQFKQILDTLFFDFIHLAETLQPKVVIAENVTGLIEAGARDYVRKIIVDFNNVGYEVKEFVLDASRMGVPQKRERLFFIAIRKDLIAFLPVNEFVMFNDFPVLDLVFSEPLIPFRKCSNDNIEIGDMPKSVGIYYDLMQGFGSLKEVHPKGSFFCEIKVDPSKPANTLTSQGKLYHPFFRRRLTKDEFCKIGSFPLDYNFTGCKSEYLIGMSVPPVMTAQIAHRIYEQWLKLLPVSKARIELPNIKQSA